MAEPGGDSNRDENGFSTKWNPRFLPSGFAKRGVTHPIFLQSDRVHDTDSGSTSISIRQSKTKQCTCRACAICLSEPCNNPVMLSHCLHAFCFECVKRWFNVLDKAECPICKQAFTFLVHDVQSETDYGVWAWDEVGDREKLTVTPGNDPDALSEILKSHRMYCLPAMEEGVGDFDGKCAGLPGVNTSNSPSNSS